MISFNLIIKERQCLFHIYFDVNNCAIMEYMLFIYIQFFTYSINDKILMMPNNFDKATNSLQLSNNYTCYNALIWQKRLFLTIQNLN